MDFMHDFDEIKPGARLRGLDSAGAAEVVQVARFGQDALNIVFRVNGRVSERLVYRGEESSFELLAAGRSYAFEADGGLLRLASEAYRIRLAYLFDPYLAVTASQIEALPHQITAVYGEMLPRQPLRFLMQSSCYLALLEDDRPTYEGISPAGLGAYLWCISANRAAVATMSAVRLLTPQDRTWRLAIGISPWCQ
jgi:hypothetical protein